MSVWKKAAKANQKTHRERHQPEERKHLGLLEKKKDYKKRATDYNDKKETLKLLRKRALNKNPDEFYYHMINSKTERGLHFDKETESEDTPDQLQLMRTQDLKYIVTKRTQELKKIEKLQSQLHLSSVNHKIRNKHVYFSENLDENYEKDKFQNLSNYNIEDIDVDNLKAASEKRKKDYLELSKRISREKELAVIQRKIEMKRHLECRKNALAPKRLKKGNKNNAPVYVWKYERKK